MNYKESAKILEEIKKAKKILVNCHKSPDPDSFGSALAIQLVLKNMGKEAHCVCTSNSSLMKEMSFLPGYDTIEKVDFSKFDFSKFDLLISPDSAEFQQIVDCKDITTVGIPLAVVDHHSTNSGFGRINIIDSESNSCAEVVLKVFEDWGVEIDKDTATLLLTGVIGDTGGLQYANTSKSLGAASKLVELGADMDKIMFCMFRNKDFNFIKIMGEFLNSMKIDKDGNFSYMAIPYEIYEKFGKPTKVASYVANAFSNVVDGTRFGLTISESEKKSVSVSIRGRGDFDVSKIAVALGGGGHKVTAAANLANIDFDEAVIKIIEVARKYAKKNNENKS